MPLSMPRPGDPAVAGCRLPLPGATAQGALAREESRGGHYRADFPDADVEARHTRMQVAHPVRVLEAAE